MILTSTVLTDPGDPSLCERQTDGQTVRQTDGQAAIAYSALCMLSRAKNLRPMQAPQKAM